MSYFCSVKTIGFFYKIIFLVFFLLIINGIEAKSTTGNTAMWDSVEVSLLTCSPHNEVYSLYGHSAIRYQDKNSGTDLVVNYGVFSFKKPYFVLRFVFGLTDYEMGIEDFSDFKSEYEYYGSSVVQQTLNLTAHEKERILKALQINYLPENRVYRYNYFYNNCTSKARDIILNNIDGKVTFKRKINPNVSFRDMIHSCNENFRWARFGNDLLLGINADRKTTRSDQQFLPSNLMLDFNDAVVVDNSGLKRPLVKTEGYVLENGSNVIRQTSSFTPSLCSWMFFFVVAAVTIFGWVRKKSFLWFDIFIMAVCGLAGVVLFLMIFSQHPATSLNLQIIMLNPLAFLCIYYSLRNRNKKEKMIGLWKGLSVLLIVFLICGLIQEYAEGMCVLASSLLVRSLYNCKYWIV